MAYLGNRLSVSPEIWTADRPVEAQQTRSEGSSKIQQQQQEQRSLFKNNLIVGPVSVIS